MRQDKENLSHLRRYVRNGILLRRRIWKFIYASPAATKCFATDYTDEHGL